MSQTLQILLTAAKASPAALDLQGRSIAPEFAVCTDKNDPMALRRVRVSTEAKGAQTQTDFLMRSLPCPGWDPPMPKLGDSLVVGFFQGNPHDGLFFGSVHNRTNPVFPKKDPWKDDWRVIPGDSTFLVGSNQVYGVQINLDIAIGENRSAVVGKNDSQTVGGDNCVKVEKKQVIEVDDDRIVKVGKKSTHRANLTVEIEAGIDVTIKTAVGAEIKIMPTGQIILRSGDGMVLPLGRMPMPPVPLKPLNIKCGE
ncbi:MAG TPA: phage baseplate assembly protein V [Vampirovibrionales bacterium]